ncbi:MAG: hypothetical protein ACRCXC_01140 [Legionella sp.]
MMKTTIRVFLIFFVCSISAWAVDAPSPWYSKSADNKIVLNIEMFLSSTCPYCHKADEFFTGLEAKSPDLHVQRYIINQDKNALIRFNQLLNEQQMSDFAVTSIFICNSRWVGFSSAETTGKDLLHAINYCKQEIERSGQLTPQTIDTLKHWANANRYTTGMVEKPSRWRYTATVAFMDSFSPCAFFCFAGFLAFLLIEAQRKKQILAGFLFLFAVALVHYFQQVNTNAFFQLLPWLRIPSALLGLATLYFIIQYYKKQFQSTVYLSLAFLLGLILSIYQQTCVMNWATIFQQWLSNQQIPGWQAGLYQLLYQSLYVFPLILILGIYLALSKTQRCIALRSRFASIGFLFLLAIALLLIIYPYALSYMAISTWTLLILIVLGYFLNLA